MLGRFYVVTFNFGDRVAPNDKIEAALSAYDWLRFSRDSYYVYAYGVTPTVLYNLLKPLLGAEDLLMVVETIAENRYGWVSQLAVEWFTRQRS